MKLRQNIKHGLRSMTAPVLAKIPLRRWPAMAGLVQDLSVPKGVIPHPQPAPAGAANINILLTLLDSVRNVEGDVAECGVYRGCTLISMGIYLSQSGSSRQIYGFDSFQGLGEEVKIDLALGSGGDNNIRPDGFSDTNLELVSAKKELFDLKNISLIPGFFNESLNRFPERRFAFVHLDCDMYASYMQCLTYFYPRLQKGGIVLLDEYNDPPWPGCNLAVDEFLKDKPEKLTEISRDNHIKYYFVKA